MEQEQGLRQRMNEHRRRQFGKPGRLLGLLCECGDPGCSRTVVLSVEEYDRLRPSRVVHHDHDRERAAWEGPSFDRERRLAR